MKAYPWLVALHVLIVLFTVGPLAALLIAPGALDVKRLARVGRLGLGLAIVTGIALDALMGGAWHAQTWFRLSFLPVIAAAVCLAQAGRASAPAGVRSPWIWAACGMLGVVTVLMEVKPG
jgi:hypothetical protein